MPTRIAAMGIAAFAVALGSPAHSLEIIPVVLSGDPAPDGPAFAPNFTQIGGPVPTVATAPVADEDGRVSFVAIFPLGIWAGDGSAGRALEKIVASGDAAPPGFTGTVASIFQQWSGGGGYSVVDTTINEPPVFEVLFSHGPAGFVEIASEGETAPGTAGIFDFRRFEVAPQVGDEGEYVFAAQLEEGEGGVTGDDDTGVWAGQDGALELLLREGDPAPGFDAGAPARCTPTPDGSGADPATPVSLILTGGGPPVAMSRDGTLALWGTIEGCPGELDVLWLREPGGLPAVVAVQGDAIGGPGSVLQSVLEISLSENGEALGLVGNGFQNGGNGISLWTRTGAGWDPIAWVGLELPGTPAGSSLIAVGRPASLADSGRAAFEAVLQNAPAGEDSGIFARGGGLPAFALAAEGTPAPGTQAGVVFDDVLDVADSSVFESDSQGNVAFTMRLTGTGVDASNDFGLWRSGPNGPVELIARTGDPIEVGPDDVRTVSDLVFAGEGGTTAGHGGGMGRDGEVAFWASFTDGSEGVFVTDAAPVPAPAPGLAQLVALGTALGVRRARPRRADCRSCSGWSR